MTMQSIEKGMDDLEKERRNEVSLFIKLLKTREKEINWQGKVVSRGYYNPNIDCYEYKGVLNGVKIVISTAVGPSLFSADILEPFHYEDLATSSDHSVESAILLKSILDKEQKKIIERSERYVQENLKQRVESIREINNKIK